MAACPCAQYAETILSVVVGYSLDETCQDFPGVRLRTISFQDSPKIRWRLPFGSRWQLTPVTELQQGIKIHENTLFLARRLV